LFLSEPNVHAGPSGVTTAKVAKKLAFAADPSERMASSLPSSLPCFAARLRIWVVFVRLHGRGELSTSDPLVVDPAIDQAALGTCSVVIGYISSFALAPDTLIG
jgi:hypothetical protein